MKMLQPPELDGDVRSIIEAARPGHEPNELARARVRKGVEFKLAAGIALAVGPAAATSAFAGALKVTAAVVAVGSVVGAGIYVIPRYTSKPTPVRAAATHVVAKAAVVAPAPVEAPLPERVAAPRAHSRHRAAVAAPVPAPVESASNLKEETALIGAANAALARGDIGRAQALLNDYDRRPGSGSALLAEERKVTGILASCAAGHVDAARAEARQFRARWPRSPLAARVDGSCAGTIDPTRSKP